MKFRSVALEYEGMLQELMSAAGDPPQMVMRRGSSPRGPCTKTNFGLVFQKSVEFPSSEAFCCPLRLHVLRVCEPGGPNLLHLLQDPDGYPNRRRLVAMCILVRELLRNRAFGPMHSLACSVLADLFSSIFVGCSISK